MVIMPIKLITKNTFSSLTFKGFCYNKDLFKQIDILIQTNENETFGRIFVEAMIFKTPIIALESEAAMNFIINGKNGYVVSTMNPDLFIEVIKLLKSDSEKYSSVIKNAFKTSLRYKTSIVNQKLDKIYKSILCD